MTQDDRATVLSAEEVRATLQLDKPRPSRWRRLLWILVPIAVLAIAVLVLPHPPRPGDGARYVTSEIARGDLQVIVTATGTVETLHTVEVGSEVTGRIQKVLVEANDRVKKGQLLAVIDPEQLRAAVTQGAAQVSAGEAAVRQARATVDEARAAAERQQRLAAEGITSKKETETTLATQARSEAALQSAEANVAAARATVDAARLKLGRATVVSPVDGVVLTRLVEVGQTLTAGFTTPVMFKIAEDLTQMRLEVDIDEADVGRTKQGQHATFTVEAYPERTFPSVLTSLRYNPTTSSSVVTYKGVLSVDNREMLLRPGMTATAIIVTETKPNVVLVPNAALRFVPPKPSGPGARKDDATAAPARGERGVYIVDERGELRRVAVKTGATDGTQTELVGDALTVGQKVVVDLRGTAR